MYILHIRRITSLLRGINAVFHSLGVSLVTPQRVGWFALRLPVFIPYSLRLFQFTVPAPSGFDLSNTIHRLRSWHLLYYYNLQNLYIDKINKKFNKILYIFTKSTFHLQNKLYWDNKSNSICLTRFQHWKTHLYTTCSILKKCVESQTNVWVFC